MLLQKTLNQCSEKAILKRLHWFVELFMLCEICLRVSSRPAGLAAFTVMLDRGILIQINSPLQRHARHRV